MAIVNRIGQLFKADMNELLDRLEEPRAVLRQAMREMETEIGGLRSRVQEICSDIKMSGKRSAELAVAISKIDDQLQLCLANDKDDLAKGCMRKKLELVKLREHLDKRSLALEEERTETVALLAEYEKKLEHIRQKADVMFDGADSNCSSGGGEASNFNVSDDEVELALLQLKHRGGQSHAK